MFSLSFIHFHKQLLEYKENVLNSFNSIKNEIMVITPNNWNVKQDIFKTT